MKCVVLSSKHDHVTLSSSFLENQVSNAETMLSSRVVTSNVDGHYYPSKTPGRLKGRVENTIYPATVNGKANLKEVSKTPYHPATLRTSIKSQSLPIIFMFKS